MDGRSVVVSVEHGDIVYLEIMVDGRSYRRGMTRYSQQVMGT